MSFFENTRKPAGFGGKLMVVMRGKYPTAAEKMPAGYRQGHRLFARQRGEIKKDQRDRHR